MEKIANVFSVIGVGIVVYAILYVNIVTSLEEQIVALILFLASLFMISSIIIKTIYNSKKYSKEKIYARLLVSLFYLIVVTINLINSF